MNEVTKLLETKTLLGEKYINTQSNYEQWRYLRSEKPVSSQNPPDSW